MRQVQKKTLNFVNEMFSNDFEAPRLGKGAGEDGYATLYRTWMSKLDQDFEHYSPEEVAAAAGVLRRTREARTFPMPSVILDALKRARKELDLEAPKKMALPARTKSYGEREALALDLLKSEMGRDAALGGWVGVLFDFARKNQRLPYDGYEVNDCKREARAFDATFAALVRGDSKAARETLIRLGDSMLRRRENLRAYVLDGQPFQWGA